MVFFLLDKANTAFLNDSKSIPIGLNTSLFIMSTLTLGDVNAVRNQVEMMSKIDPKFTRADYLLSNSKKYSKGDKHIEEMEHKLNNYNLTKFSKTLLYFSLGKAYEDIKDYQKS